MITGDKHLTAIHVAKDVEIADRDALVLDRILSMKLVNWFIAT